MSKDLYPKSPKNLPKNLTKLPASYQFRALLAIVAIILFFALYIALVVALGYLVKYAITYDIGRINRYTVILKIGSVLGAVMLFAFTLKFIFKIRNHKAKNRIKLDKNKQVDLWNFIDQICKETGAPKPKNIYVDPDVNAYVAYSNMWLSLFLPVKKELTIGLGLVNCLNKSEFKAVISHEFGHFAQSSMKIGSYIISANTIIHDMIYTRDSWDNLLDQWRASDIRLSFAAWIITPIIWIIRQVLALFYQFLNIMYSSLSREMEFNADKVAISTSGSDAIISALWKLDAGFEKWNNAINHLYLASKKKIFTQNIYTHNSIDIERDLAQTNEILTKLPQDKRGGKEYFSKQENSKVSMYASHPPNIARQENAKSPYIPCEIEQSSPWLIFNDTTEIQELATKIIYKHYFEIEPKAFNTIDEFESFIKAEAKDRKILKEYDTFEHRFFEIPEIKKIVSANFNGNRDYNKQITALKNDLKTLMKPVQKIEALMKKAENIANGTSLEKSFTFLDKEFNKKNIQDGYSKLFNEREKLFNESFKEWDKQFCVLHYNIAKETNQEGQLIYIYRQHKAITKLYKSIIETKNTIIKDLNALQAKGEVLEFEVTELERKINTNYLTLNTFLDSLDEITFVPLTNIETLDELKETIIEGKEFHEHGGKIFENGGFDRLIASIDNAIIQCQRIDQKNIGKILRMHQELIKNCSR